MRNAECGMRNAELLQNPENCTLSTKLDICGVHVGNVDSVGFQRREDFFHVGPVVFKGHGFHFFPIAPNFGRVIGWAIEIGSAKVEAEWRAYDGHFERQEFVVVVG